MTTGSDFVWVLFLNDMRSAHFEELVPVARAMTRETLVAYVRREKCETYLEPTGRPMTEENWEPGLPTRFNPQKWCKVFRKGGHLVQKSRTNRDAIFCADGALP